MKSSALRILVFILLFVLSQRGLQAQLCQGSLGDPIIRITFGSGANPGPSLHAATTSYQYVSQDCPNDGSYTVRNSTTACFGDSWHSLQKDHTGDPGGYFMLVNASFQPSAFYIDTVRGLCGGTTYEFAAWVINVLKTTACPPSPTQPNLTFSIENTDGTVLQSHNTNTINSLPVPAWQQFGFFFTTPMNVSDVVVRIFNNAPGGCGNDLALDDITFRPCGPKLQAAIVGSTMDTVVFCEGTSRSFTFTSALSTGFSNPSFQWQESTDGISWTDIPGAIGSGFSKNFTAATAPGKYRYRLSSAEAGNMGTSLCRIASETLMIHIAENPVTNATSNGPVCENKSLTLSASGASDYAWTGPGNFSASGSQVSIALPKVNQSGKYYVLAKTVEGCTNLDSVTVSINPNPVASVSFSNVSLCENEQVVLESSGGSTYQWLPSAGLSADNIARPVASPEVTTNYSVIVGNQFSCTDTATVTVNVIEAPTANAGDDKWIIEGTAVQLAAAANGQNVTNTWSPPVFIDDVQSLQPVVNPPRDTTYVLTVVSNDGCGTATDTVKIFVYKDLYIPSAFTPNNDGLNDTWNIPALNAFPNFELTVFNRQGQVIYQNKHSNVPWDGRYKGELQPVGVYVYYIDLKVQGGKFKGTVTLLR